jgi:MFS family permease
MSSTNTSVPFLPSEKSASLWLASIAGLRMLGLFIILPVFALYAEKLPGGQNHTLIGIALGAYGLAQAVLQIPFGWASDRFGRKPALYVGLALFAVGSFMAAAAGDIYGVIAGRVLQGAGAVSGVVMALTADLTRDTVRAKAMAIVGITIGVSFELSFVFGPVLERWIGVPGIFVMTGVLALLAMTIIRWRVPNPAQLDSSRQVKLADFGRALTNPKLLRLNYGIFALHAALMALFVEVPFLLRAAGIVGDARSGLYLAVTLVSLLLIAPFMRGSHNATKLPKILIGAIATLCLAQLILAYSGGQLPLIIIGLTVFFAAFNLLEISLPTLTSLLAPPEIKGTAMGIYASLQFIGTFVGGAVGGYLAQHQGGAAVFWFCTVLSAIWLIIAFKQQSIQLTKE